MDGGGEHGILATFDGLARAECDAPAEISRPASV
jgi:hypothetical protein